MTITTTTLTRGAGLAAVAGGLLFVGVQIEHPHLDAGFATTTEYALRETAKICMAILSLLGVTGIYLRQVERTGILGLLGYLSFSAGYLTILSIQVIGVSVLPALAEPAPAYVDDVLAVATGGTATGDVGLLSTLNQVGGLAYLAGGFLFGIALVRAHVLPRWAAALLAAGAGSTLLIPLLPQIEPRLFAVPVGIALVCLGYSLWREQRTPAGRPVPNDASPHRDPAGVR